VVRVGIAGIGFMGTTHYKALKQMEGARVSAICTRDPKKQTGDWRDPTVHKLNGPPGCDLVVPDGPTAKEFQIRDCLAYQWARRPPVQCPPAAAGRAARSNQGLPQRCITMSYQ
jgi:hypothetical protein